MPMPATSIMEITLVVADVDRSAAFYRALGIPLFDYAEFGEVHHFDGVIGQTALQLWPAGAQPVSRVQLGFRVTDIDAIAAALTDLGIDYERPMRRRLRTRDPDGNPVHMSEIV
jgi:catechol 2,3-dioxygenase-like lactoylglutathione lyase family enzyme